MPCGGELIIGASLQPKSFAERPEGNDLTQTLGGNARGKFMPYYEYKCAKCGATFTVMRSMAEQERLGQIKCPECASKQVVRVYSPVLVRTSKKA